MTKLIQIGIAASSYFCSTRLTPVVDTYKIAQFSKNLATWTWVTTGLTPRRCKKVRKINMFQFEQQSQLLAQFVRTTNRIRELHHKQRRSRYGRNYHTITGRKPSANSCENGLPVSLTGNDPRE